MPSKWDQYASEPQSSGNKWDQFASSENPAPTQQAKPPQSFLQNLKSNYESNVRPYTPDEQKQHGPVDTALHNFGAGAGQTLLGPIMHPLDTLKGIGESLPPVQAYKAITGQPTQGQQLGGGIVNDFKQNGVQALPHLAGQVAGMAIGSKVPEIGAGAMAETAPLRSLVSGSPEGIGGVSTPSLLNRVGIGSPPSALSAIEKSAVDITKAVNPQQSAWNSYLESAQSQTGNVLDYAKRNNLPISDARDFAKAAKGAAAETRQHYQDNFLDPNTDVQVSVPGSYQGDKVGEGNRATLGDVDKRVNAITRELKSNFRKPTPGQVSSAGASDAELEAEHRALTDLLHNKLGELTGVSPDDIKGLRVRGGQLSTLAGETQGAANTLSGAAAKSDSGVPSIPTSSGGLLKEGLTALRGGPEKIAASSLRKALSSAPMDTSELLQPGTPSTPQVAPRLRPLAGGNTTSVPTFDATPDADAANSLQSKIASRNSLRDITSAQNKQAALSEFLHSTDLEKAAQDAGNTRSTYAKGMRDRLGNASYLDRTGGKDFRRNK